MIVKAAEISDILDSFEYRVGFTNGCFDIIHAGHIQYLLQAKDLCDILIVGLNSDGSVKSIKGESRPINNQYDRAFVLDNLSMVDNVIIFEEETPYNLICQIKPDILIKGGDWKISDIVGGDVVLAYGGEVVALPYRDGYSTTGIIEKMQR